MENTKNEKWMKDKRMDVAGLQEAHTAMNRKKGERTTLGTQKEMRRERGNFKEWPL